MLAVVKKPFDLQMFAMGTDTADADGQHFSKVLEPAVRKWFFDEYNLRPEQYPLYMNVDKMTGAVVLDHRSTGVGLWEEKGKREPTKYDEMIDGDDIRYIPKTFSKGIQIEKEWYDDNQVQKVKSKAKDLGRTARVSIEVNTIELLNKGFDVANKIYDGKPLFATDHPRLDGGTAVCNLTTGALTEANLELALKLSREQVDDRGLKIQMMPRRLFVPPALYFTAQKIVKSAQSTSVSAGFAVNDINAIRGRLEVVVLDWLESDTAWFICDPDLNQLNFFWREKLSFTNMVDFDTDVAKYKGRMRYAYGVSDFRGWIGSTGI